MILEAKNIQKKVYLENQQELNILIDISFVISKGEKVAITGASGSGKTTLLAICASLDSPSSGEIIYDNTTKLSSLNEDQRALFRLENIGFIFQNFQLIPNISALQNILVPLEMQKKSSKRDAVIRANEILKLVGLEDRAHQLPSQLSGGEQQRVAIARAIVHQPKILFADEPTGNLDEETGEKIIDLLFKVSETNNMSLVAVTHNGDLAKKLDKTYRMVKGQLSE